MNPRERFWNSCLGGPVDRPFRFENGPWPTTLELWRGQGYPEGKEYAEVAGLDRLVRPLFDHFGFVQSPFFPKFREEMVESGEGWDIVRDGDGIVKKVFHEHGDLSMPQFLRFPVEDRDDWEQLKKRLQFDTPGRTEGWDAEIAPLAVPNRDFPVYMTICGAYGLPRNLLGPEKVGMTFYDDPELVHDIQRTWVELYKGMYGYVLDRMEVDGVLFWEDMAYKTGSLISPAHVREFMLPYYHEMIAFLRERGVKVIWLDSDGDLGELIPLFLEFGVDGIIPFEVQAGMDVVAIRKQYGPAFCIIGGIDKRELAKDFAAIEREVERVMTALSKTGRFIPCLDHTVPPNVPFQNFLHYRKTVTEFERHFSG